MLTVSSERLWKGQSLSWFESVILCDMVGKKQLNGLCRKIDLILTPEHVLPRVTIALLQVASVFILNINRTNLRMLCSTPSYEYLRENYRQMI